MYVFPTRLRRSGMVYNGIDMATLKQLETEINAIQARNRRVEGDKAWETSGARRLFIAASTYILITIFMVVLGVDRPFTAAIIPAVAYLISTLTLGILKSWWLEKRK